MYAENMLPLDLVETQSVQCGITAGDRRERGAVLNLCESFRKNQWDSYSPVIQTKRAVSFYRPHKVKNDVHQCPAMRGHCPFPVHREKTSAEQTGCLFSCHTPHVEAHSPSQPRSRISGGTRVGCHSHLPHWCSELSSQIAAACQNQWPVKEQLVIKNSTTSTNLLCQFHFAPKTVNFCLWSLSAGPVTPQWHFSSPVLD